MIDACDMSLMRPLLAAHGFHFSKAKGQNFLTADWVPEQIAQCSGADETSGVLEVGPGVGSLTQRLCRRGSRVLAVELDRRLEPILAQTVGEYPNLQLLWGDILKQDIRALAEDHFPGLRKLACANLPYYITTPVISALLEAECFETVTVMVQREVAQRIAAAPGSEDYGAFSLFCQFYARPEVLFQVPASCFVPQPKVTSAVVALRVRKELPWEVRDRALFFRTVRASFAMRRKKLENGLAAAFPQLGKAGAGELLASCGLPENVRGETLDIGQFARLSNAIGERLEGG